MANVATRTETLLLHCLVLAISREAEVSVRFSIGDSLAEKNLFSARSIPLRGMATGSRVAEGEEQRDLALEAVVSPRHLRQLPTRTSGEPLFSARVALTDVAALILAY